MAGTDRANHGGIGRLALPIATLGLALAGLVGLAAVSSGDYGGSSATRPRRLSPPSISGIAVAGQRLTASPGTWSHAPTSFRYKWKRCNRAGTISTPVVHKDNCAISNRREDQMGNVSWGAASPIQ